jgi:putative transposase
MPDYRRNRVPGGTCFFTVNLLDRSGTLLVTHVGLLRDAVPDVRARSPFHSDARVVLPEHMHCIWTLPPGDDDFSGRWRALKKSFTRAIPPTEPRSPARRQRHEPGIWQRRSWEHTIRDDRDDASHMDYVHFNPVKHELVTHPSEWPYSSFRRCVAAGWYHGDWRVGASDQTERGEGR